MSNFHGKGSLRINGTPVGAVREFSLCQQTKSVHGSGSYHTGSGGYRAPAGDPELDIAIDAIEFTRADITLDGARLGRVEGAKVVFEKGRIPTIELKTLRVHEGRDVIVGSDNRLAVSLGATPAASMPPWALDEKTSTIMTDAEALELRRHLDKWFLNSRYGKMGKSSNAYIQDGMVCEAEVRPTTDFAKAFMQFAIQEGIITNASQLTEGFPMSTVPDVSVFQTNFTTVVVTCPGVSSLTLSSREDKVFKTRRFDLKPGDKVVLEKGGYLVVGAVKELHQTPQLVEGVLYSWIVQVLDTTAYEAELTAEADFRATMARVEQTRKREQAIRFFSSGLEGNPEAQALFTDAVAKMTGGNLHFRAMPEVKGFDTSTNWHPAAPVPAVMEEPNVVPTVGASTRN